MIYCRYEGSSRYHDDQQNLLDTKSSMDKKKIAQVKSAYNDADSIKEIEIYNLEGSCLGTENSMNNVEFDDNVSNHQQNVY